MKEEGENLPTVTEIITKAGTKSKSKSSWSVLAWTNALENSWCSTLASAMLKTPQLRHGDQSESTWRSLKDRRGFFF